MEQEHEKWTGRSEISFALETASWTSTTGDATVDPAIVMTVQLNRLTGITGSDSSDNTFARRPLRQIQVQIRAWEVSVGKCFLGHGLGHTLPRQAPESSS